MIQELKMKYKNPQTENVLNWLSKEPKLVKAAHDFMMNHPDASRPYKDFIAFEGMEFLTTPDGVYWNWSQLDFKVLNEFMRQLFKDEATATDGLPPEVSIHT